MNKWYHKIKFVSAINQNKQIGTIYYALDFILQTACPVFMTSIHFYFKKIIELDIFTTGKAECALISSFFFELD